MQQNDVMNSLPQTNRDQSTDGWQGEDSDDLGILTAYGARSTSPLVVWNGRAAALATVGLLIVLAESAATTTWRLLGHGLDNQHSTLAVNTTGSSADAAATKIDVQTIVDAHLFGTVAAEPKAVQAETPPDTDLELVLKGIVFSDVPADARAIIAAPEGRHGAYAIGSFVPGDATLVEIRRTLVVLDRGGRRETLRLETKPTSNSSNDGDRLPHRNIDKRGNYQLSKVLGGFQTRLQTNPASAMSLIRIAPERNGEHMLGVRIFPGPERGFMERLELQPGDLITHINNIKIDSASKGLEALRMLSATREISLRIQRGERRLAFAFRVSQ